MIAKGLKAVFDFVVDAHRERAKRYTDWPRESRRYDRYGDDELLDGMNGEKFVRIGDVMQILYGIRGRTEYRFNDNDWDQYVAPVFAQLKHRIERGIIPCHLALIENVLPDGRVRVQDFIAVLNDFDLPDARSPFGPRARQSVAVAVDEPAAPATTRWESWRQHFAATFPLRTPSSDVRYEDVEEEHRLNIRRPLVIALGLAHILREETRNIELGEIPTYTETAMQRRINDQKPKPPRYYRGQRLD